MSAPPVEGEMCHTAGRDDRLDLELRLEALEALEAVPQAHAPLGAGGPCVVAGDRGQGVGEPPEGRCRQTGDAVRVSSPRRSDGPWMAGLVRPCALAPDPIEADPQGAEGCRVEHGDGSPWAVMAIDGVAVGDVSSLTPDESGVQHRFASD